MQERSATTTRRDGLAGALVVALFALFFLRGAIFDGRAGVLGPDDCSQGFALTNVDPDARPSNPELERTWTTYQSWTRMSHDRLLGGELPVWNGFNGGGVPHLANPQTAVFSPFSWSFYALEPASAAWVAAFLKLFAVGFATFLFLRELRLAFAASVLGAVVFMVSPAEITTLLSPVAGTVILLPAGLFLAERIARGVEAPTGDRKSLRRASIAFVLVIAAALFGGALDTFVFCALVVAAWIVVRFAGIARGDRASRREIAIAAAHLALVALVAACVCAVQVLPYLEFVRGSREPTTATAAVALPPWHLLFFPGLLGGTAGVEWFGTAFAPDFTTGAALAVGALPLALALLGFSATARGGTGWFFAAAGLAGVLVGAGGLGDGLLAGLFPFQPEPESQRALALLPFAVAVLGALAVDRVARSETGARQAVVLTLFVVAAGIVLAARHFALRLLESSAIAGERAAASTAHVELVVATFLAGAGALAVAAALPKGRLRSLALSALIVIAYVGVGAPFEDWNPVTPARYVLPQTQGIAQRSGMIGNRGSLVLGGIDVPADVNGLYGLYSLSVNDPLRVLRFDQLREALFAPRGEYGVATHTTQRALELFGVAGVLDADGWIDVDTELVTPARGADRRVTAEITSTTPVAQVFQVPRNGMKALRFPWITKGVPNQREYSITVDDLDTGARLAELVVTPWAVRPAGRDVVDGIVPIQGGADVAGHRLLLRVTTEDDAPAGSSYAIGCNAHSQLANSTWRAGQGGRELEGQVDLGFSYAFDAFEPQGRVGPFGLYRFTHATPRYRTLGSARVVASDGAAWSAILAPDFAASSEVILEGAPPELARRSTPEDEAHVRLEVLDALDGHVRLIAKRTTPGFVVTPIAWYPGWTAKVNSAAAKPLCANYAFTAVAVPAGESLVEFDYEPKSVRKGLILSLAGLLILFVAFATTLPPERRA